MATATATKPGATSRSQVSQLTQFTWTGKDKRGITMRGEVLGKNANLVKAHLRKQGINATKVVEKKASIFGKAGQTEIALRLHDNPMDALKIIGERVVPALR